MRGSKAKIIRKFMATLHIKKYEEWRKFYKRFKKTPNVAELIKQEYRWRRDGINHNPSL